MASKLKQKSIESPLYVYRANNNEPILIGQLSFIEDRVDGFLAQFFYDQSYVSRPDAYALDPLNMPLADASRKFSTTSRYHVLGALFDAAPDAWGRRIIHAKEGVSQIAEKEVLLRGHGMGVGEVFFAGSLLTQLPPYSSVHTFADLDLLADPIMKIDEGEKFNPAWENLLVSSWDIGGARPKAILQDEHGAHWIAKFPKRGESFDRQRVEWANLEMAKDIGMNVPDHKIIDTAHGAVFLIKRFDRENGTKQHFLSAASLISPSPDIAKRAMDSALGRATFSYARIADTIQRISRNPVRDLQELYARMVFNVTVHNVDDHLKNTGFLRQAGAADPYAYELSPLFDVVTQETSSKHMLHIGKFGRESTLENALSEFTRMRIKKDTALMIADRVADVFSHRRTYYDQAGLSREDIAAVERCLS